VLNDPATGEVAVEVLLSNRGESAHIATELAVAQCTNVEWREYNLVVDPDRWSEYWLTAKDQGFSYGIKFAGYSEPVPADSMGFAFIDSTSSSVAASCGCMWQ
jgi:hypothetical protein